MSNSSGITPTPPGGIKPSSGAQVVPIKSLPDGLQSVSRTLHLEGEVIAQNPDGSTRVKTAEGAIDITIRGRQPQPGQKIEIDIPAGNPPRQATVRNTAPTPSTTQPATPAPSEEQPPVQLPPILTRPAEQPPVTTRPATPQTPLPPTGTTQAPATPPAIPDDALPSQIPSGQSPPVTAKPVPPPLPGSYQPSPASLQAINTPLPPLTPGQTTYLQPVPPAQAQAMMQVIAAQISRTGQATDLIAQNQKDTLVKILTEMIAPEGKNATSSPSLSPQQPSAGTATATPLSPALQDLPDGQILPNTGNMIGSGQISFSDAEGNPLETLIKSFLSSPRLAQTGLKVIEVRPFLTQTAQTGITPSAPAISTGSMASAPSITATVLGLTQNNLPIVTMTWPGGGTAQPFILQQGAGNLTPGTEIILQPQIPVPGQNTAKPIPSIPLFDSAALWSSMDDAYQSLLQTAPNLAQAMAKILPSPSQPAQFGSAALFFIAAARLGNLNEWLGEDRIEALGKSAKSSLLSRLSGEAGTISRANADAASNDWRSYPLPLLWQNDISRVLLHVKHEAPDKDKDHQEGATRFIFDLALPRMGDVQLDGLVRGKRLDLIIRTETPISSSMQDSMKKAYADALDGTDIFGELGFQGDLKHWVQVVKRDKHLGVSA